MTKYPLLAAVLALFVCRCEVAVGQVDAPADRIVLQDGTEVAAQVVAVTADSLYLSAVSAPGPSVRVLGRDEVFVVVYANGEREVFGASAPAASARAPDPTTVAPPPRTAPSTGSPTPRRPASASPTPAPTANAPATGTAGATPTQAPPSELTVKSYYFGRVYRRGGERISRREFLTAMRETPVAHGRLNSARIIKTTGAAAVVGGYVWGILAYSKYQDYEDALEQYNRFAGDVGLERVEQANATELIAPLGLHLAGIVATFVGDAKFRKAVRARRDETPRLGLRYGGSGAALVLTF